MGYESGPEDPEFLGGAQGAVFKALGLKNNEVVEIACLKDQSVPVGPVITHKAWTRKHSYNGNME